MLVQFSAKNFVLIEELVLSLEPGFNVLTGETGAGKSLVVDALGLVLGARASGDLVRAGAEEAEAEALFDISSNERARAILASFEFPPQGELLLRRVVSPQGRSRAFINGRLATAAQLAELARALCDIASQHESVHLTEAGTHLDYLDAFGGLAEDRTALELVVTEASALAVQLDEWRERGRTRAEREEMIAWALREIDEVSPLVGEDTELLSERARLRHAARLGDATAKAAGALEGGDGGDGGAGDAGDGGPAVCDVLSRLEGDLSGAAALDPSLAPHVVTLATARAELVELSRALSHYAGSVNAEVNPTRLADVEERLFRLEKLFRKHAQDGGGAASVLEKRAALDEEARTLSSSDAEEKKLQAAFEQAMDAASERARVLSQKRKKAGEKLGKAIAKELADLGMGGARVLVEVTRAPAGSCNAASSRLMVDGAHLSAKGLDRVEFLIAPNKGEEPRPLRRIASGGELSRALLAIKRVLAKNGPAGFYVFDEVDTGTSGAIAEVIGRKMADVARHHQVLAITHLPQIASLADSQFVVGKTVTGDRTSVSVRKLKADERVGEIARMIGGVNVGQAAKKAAKELLDGRNAA